MSRSKFLLLALGLLGIGLGVYLLWPADDRTVITSRIQQLATLASYPPEEHPLRKQQALGKMKALLSQDLVLKVNLPGGRSQAVEGRKEFMERVQEVRFGLAALKVEFDVQSIELSSDHRMATVGLTLSAQIGVEKQQEFQEMKLQLEKSSDEWLIKRLETVRTYGR